VVTSWTVHLSPYELQYPAIAAAKYALGKETRDTDEFEKAFCNDTFQLDDREFFAAAGLLAKNCLFTYAGTLGYGKARLAVDADHVGKTLERLASEGALANAVDDCEKRLAEYSEAVPIFEGLLRKAGRGREFLEPWILAAKNLKARAEASLLLLRWKSGARLDSAEVAASLDALAGLKAETAKMYREVMLPRRSEEITSVIFDPVENELKARLAGK